MSVYSIDFPNDSPDEVFILSSITMPMIFLYIPRGKAKDAAASEEIHDKTRGVYILYGKGEIYVGQTKRGVDRIKDHEISLRSLTHRCQTTPLPATVSGRTLWPS